MWASCWGDCVNLFQKGCRPPFCVAHDSSLCYSFRNRTITPTIMGAGLGEGYKYPILKKICLLLQGASHGLPPRNWLNLYLFRFSLTELSIYWQWVSSGGGHVGGRPSWWQMAEQRLSLFCLSHWACWPNLSLATGHTKNREVGREHGILYEKEIANLLLQVAYPFFGIIGTGNVLDFGLFWILEDLHKHYEILGMRSFIHVQYTPL